MTPAETEEEARLLARWKQLRAQETWTDEEFAEMARVDPGVRMMKRSPEVLRLQAEVRKLREALTECADQLEEVRTGSDFEVQCWIVAEQARAALSGEVSE